MTQLTQEIVRELLKPFIIGNDIKTAMLLQKSELSMIGMIFEAYTSYEVCVAGFDDTELKTILGTASIIYDIDQNHGILYFSRLYFYPYFGQDAYNYDSEKIGNITRDFFNSNITTIK